MVISILQVAALVIVTTAIHGFATALLINLTPRVKALSSPGRASWKSHVFVSTLVLFMVIVGFFEAFIWACYYVQTGKFSELNESMYFSLVTMTTLGYGDVTLQGEGRTVSGIQAALGIVLFGWTTSIIFTAVQAIHSKD